MINTQSYSTTSGQDKHLISSLCFISSQTSHSY